MKHLKSISKPQTASTSAEDIISIILAVIEALAPIITWLIESKGTGE